MAINSCLYFAGKKITVVGLGLLGRGVGDIKFLAECGADLIVTDLKSERELAPSLRRLKKFKNIKYILGRHRLQDFRNRDFIIKAAGVPLDSPFLKEARKNGIPIKMSTALFTKLAMTQGIKIVGVTGTRGKSTVAMLIYEILRAAGCRVHLGGNVRGVSTLALLKKIKPGDWVVLELDSWQLQGFGEEKISPHIAVFTNFLDDHLNYYRGDRRRYWQDKTNIFKYQKAEDWLVLGEQFKTQNEKRKITAKNSKIVIADGEIVPDSWKIKLLGEHNRQNAALAVKVAEIVGVPRQVIKQAVENFRGVSGRLELIRTWRGIKIYNDTTSTTPDAVIAALKALGKRIVLIAGGADKGLDMRGLVREIPKHYKAVVLLPGSGTRKLKVQNAKRKITTQNLKEAVQKAVSLAKRGDVILFSPGFASFGPPPGGFRNEFDRGNQFVRLVSRLK